MNDRKTRYWQDIATLVIWALPPLYLIANYADLPPQMPLHFGINGNPDRIGTKQAFLLVVLLISILGLAVALLIRFVPRIDPMKKVRYSPDVFARISRVLLLLIAFLTGVVVYAGTQGHFALRGNRIFPIIALFLAVFGSMLGNIRPNYFVGIRTPWTLHNEEVWKKTHRFAAKVWLPGGIALAIVTFFAKENAALFIYIAGMLLLVLIPVVYSYRCYIKHYSSRH